jgi:hypothetical protein
MISGPAGPVPKVRPLICPNCGGQIEIRGFGQAINSICGNCQTVLDATTPSLAILQQFPKRARIEPKIPLGTRGKWHGAPHEVIGFQVREIAADGERYQWGEYLLFNPYSGYRYLTEFDGHWNDVRTVRALPQVTPAGAKATVSYSNAVYKIFQTSTARTVFVLGEFPWQVRVGDPVIVCDYIRPPFLMSSEATGNEINWSLSEYVSGQSIWQAFNLPGQPPPVKGVFANQPSPYTGKIGSVWKTFAWLVGLLFLSMVVMAMINQNKSVFKQNYSFDGSRNGEASFVTPVFELTGHPSNVEVKVSTNLSNDWAYFNFALINEETGNAYDFGREVSYYFGSDSDGSWSEGNKNDSVTIPSVPAGRYYLRVEPEMDAKSGSLLFNSKAMNYDLEIKRDVPSQVFFVIVFFLLFIPPIVVTMRVYKFESRRWAESDYAPVASSSSGDDD